MHLARIAATMSVGVLVSTSAFAQRVVHELDDVPNFSYAVRVVVESGAEISGRLIDRTPSSLSVLVGGQEVRLRRDEIRRVYRPDDPIADGMRRGALAGMVAGVAIGLLAPADECRTPAAKGAEIECFALHKTGTTITGLILGGAGGMLAGLWLDRRHSASRLIYERRDGPTIAVAPIIAREGKGLSLSIAW